MFNKLNAYKKMMAQFLFGISGDFQKFDFDPEKGRSVTIHYATRGHNFNNKEFTFEAADGLIPTLLEKFSELEQQVRNLQVDCIKKDMCHAQEMSEVKRSGTMLLAKKK